MGLFDLINGFLGLPKRDGSNSSRDTLAVSENRSRSNGSSESKEIDLENIIYIPLPPSPPAWQVSQERNKDFYDSYEKSYVKDIFNAYWKQQYNKVIKLIDTVPASERTGEVGHTFIKAYRNIIQRWRNKGKPAEALKWSDLMMENLANLVTDTDKRRHNKLIDELDSAKTKHSYSKYIVSAPSKKPLFQIPEWCNWLLDSEESISKDNRPDLGFRDLYPTIDGCLMVDSKGRSNNAQKGNAAIKKMSHKGVLIREAPLTHDIYRFSANPLGTGFVALSADCGFFAYNKNAEMLFKRDLKNIAEAKNYIRCIDISPEMDRLLYSIIDEVWCISSTGEQIWSVKMPPKAGWEKVVERVDKYGTNREITDALSLMSLSFPFSIEDVKKKYRELALKWHPDLNPNDSTSHEKMQKLNAAVEILTGMEASSFFDLEAEIVTYKKVLHHEKINLDNHGSFDLEASMVGPGEDWVYAASFGEKGVTYLGAYSGRIVELDVAGSPQHVFDVGLVPEKIFDNGNYLYIQTSTRLYILHGDKLLKIIDIFDKGKVIFAQSGFGLLASKSFKWFDEKGGLKGEISSKDPIRQVYPKDSNLVVETRQHRAIVNGAPSWWLNVQPPNTVSNLPLV